MAVNAEVVLLKTFTQAHSPAHGRGALHHGRLAAGVDLDAVAAQFFGRETRCVRLGQQVGVITGTGHKGHHPNAGSRREDVTRKRKTKRGNELAQRVRSSSGLAGRFFMHQHGKFITTQAGQHGTVFEPSLQYTCQATHQLVTCTMPGGVVHEFEIVQIQIQQGEIGLGLGLEPCFGGGLKPAAVGQAGEFIRARLAQQTLGGQAVLVGGTGQKQRHHRNHAQEGQQNHRVSHGFGQRKTCQAQTGQDGQGEPHDQGSQRSLPGLKPQSTPDQQGQWQAGQAQHIV